MKTPTTPDAVRGAVRETYSKIALNQQSDCCTAGGCCTTDRLAATPARELGYKAEEVAAAPEGADLGLGCGNPQAIASLKPGEAVLDLGSGAGFDCFIAARSVGLSGRVIGVDMTPEMIGKARANATKADVTNVEFRLGEIEALPVADNSIDVIRRWVEGQNAADYVVSSTIEAVKPSSACCGPRTNNGRSTS